MGTKKEKDKPYSKEEVTGTFSMEGTIVITDPCYLRHVPGLKPTHSRSTIYGDWGCSVWSWDPEKESGPKEGSKPFGKFCADGGEVCVTVLSKEDLKKFSEWLGDREWIATIIPNFKGEVSYVEVLEHYKSDYDHKWYDNRSLRVKGVGTKDGKPFAFISAQTSL